MNSEPLSSDDGAPPTNEVDTAIFQLLDQLDSHVDLVQFSENDRRKVVDLIWLDSLLHQSQNRDGLSVTTNRAIERVLTQLRSDFKSAKAVEGAVTVQPVSDVNTVSRRSPRRRGWRSRLTVAVVLFIAAVGWWQTQPRAAKAMFEKAMEAALTQDDRVYQVTITPVDSASAPRKGRLTVRGGEKFVFERIGPLGGRLAIGGNGKEFWLAPPVGAVLIANSENVVPEWSQKPDLNMPFLQITTILRRMRDAYRLTRLPSDALDGYDGPMNHLIADRRLRARGPFGMAPSKIEMWTAPETGIVHRLVVHWSPDDNARRFDRIELNLTKEVPETAEIYNYSHYAPDRPIRKVSEPQ